MLVTYDGTVRPVTLTSKNQLTTTTSASRQLIPLKTAVVGTRLGSMPVNDVHRVFQARFTSFLRMQRHSLTTTGLKTVHILRRSESTFRSML